ncbi:hypothetical protein LuPra_00541 [Luteitalea pratensis]|uniref:Uncharacterized protein n=1 Tax=Luteitalea pratensis TaxID=1855912 RepID=A0A143PHY6_LUTPR|nr:hypothetical protein [Luteitalea pratensis]AMY07374.1 hypothetical protein LuPra_00541 [Luteitalea pratensis]
MAESKMTVVHAVLASSALLLVFAALVWTGTIDLGIDPMPLTAVLVLAAVMDVVVAAIFLRRLSR